MAQLPQARKPCTINHLALIMGLIGSVEIGEEERKLIDAELDKARALETQLQWGVL